MKIIIATNNSGKVKEFKKMLSPLGYEPVSLKDEGISVEVEEDGKTFEENAHKKAKTIYDICHCPVVADDSGLQVDYLNGAPGIYSARYVGEGATGEQLCRKILSELYGVDKSQRGAQFLCSLFCILDDEREYSVNGEFKGSISFEMRGTNGFGYDPIFEVDGRTVAEMDEEEKNTISHRAIALKKLTEILRRENHI